MTESDIYQLVGEAYCNGMAHGMEKAAGMQKRAGAESKLTELAAKILEKGMKHEKALEVAANPGVWMGGGAGIGGLSSYLSGGNVDQGVVQGALIGGLARFMGGKGLELGSRVGTDLAIAGIPRNIENLHKITGRGLIGATAGGGIGGLGGSVIGGLAGKDIADVMAGKKKLTQ